METRNRTTHRILLGAVALVAVVGIGAAAYGSVNDVPGIAASPTTVVEATAPMGAGAVPAAADAELDASVADGVVFMIEEEKLARDVYTTLEELWGLPIFGNIASAEQTHMDAVLTLVDGYGLTDPVGDNPVGVFVNPELQTMYDDLIATGSTSPAAALEVGAVIEEVDIEDLETYLGEATQSDVITVYERLLAGSENHLSAFVSQLESNGIDRDPVVLDQASYDTILSSSMVGAGRGQGRGQGQGQGQKGGPGRGNGRSV